MLRWRLLSAAVILCLLLTLAACDFYRVGGTPPGTWLLPWLLLVTVMGTEETLWLLAAKNHRPVQWPVYVGSIGTTLAFAWPIWSKWFDIPSDRFQGDCISLPMVVLALATSLVFAVEMRRFDKPGQHVVHIALVVFAIVYVGVLGGFMVALRLFDGDNGRGMAALVSAILVIKMADAGAYGFGRLLGATKLTPRLSPGKTVEGAIGGLATACVASWAFFHFLAPQLMGSGSYSPPSWLAMMLYGLILAIAGMIGDLAESLLKRDMERKDSSTWLRGLGGVLDVIDSLLVGAPAAYLCWELGLVR